VIVEAYEGAVGSKHPNHIHGQRLTITAHVSASLHHLYRIITCKETHAHSSARAAISNDQEPNERQPSHHVLLETQPSIDPAIAILIRQPQRKLITSTRGAHSRRAKSRRATGHGRQQPPRRTCCSSNSATSVPVRASEHINHQTYPGSDLQPCQNLSLETPMQVPATRHSLQEREHPQRLVKFRREQVKAPVGRQ
jgi:hypothetical protein